MDIALRRTRSGFVAELYSLALTCGPSSSPTQDPHAPQIAALSDRRVPPIETYVHSTIVSVYLGKVYFSSASLDCLETFDDVLDRCDLCKRMQTTGWDDAIFSAMQNEAWRAPWSAFQFAASVQCVKIAKAAVKHFAKDPDCPPSQWPQYTDRYWHGIAVDWFTELIRLRTTLRSRIRQGIALMDYKPWPDVAAHFSPGHPVKVDDVVSISFHFDVRRANQRRSVQDGDAAHITEID